MSSANRFRALVLTALVLTALWSGASALLDRGNAWQNRVAMLALAALSNGILAGVIVRAVVRGIAASRSAQKAVRNARQQEPVAASESAERHVPRHSGKVRYEVARRQIFPFRW